MALSHYGKSYLARIIQSTGLLGLGYIVYDHYKNGHSNDTLGWVFVIMYFVGLILGTKVTRLN